MGFQAFIFSFVAVAARTHAKHVCHPLDDHKKVSVPTMYVIHLKRIKMKPDGPCKMGLTDPCLWADKRQAQFM